MAEPLEMIAELRRKAARLLEAAKVIEESFGISPQSQNGNGKTTNHADKPTRRGPKKKNRVAELNEFLKANGPMRRKDIIEKCGIPAGTVNMLLKAPEYTRDEEGRWGVASP
jgi:hypothetical protein